MLIIALIAHQPHPISKGFSRKNYIPLFTKAGGYRVTDKILGRIDYKIASVINPGHREVLAHLDNFLFHLALNIPVTDIINYIYNK